MTFTISPDDDRDDIERRAGAALSRTAVRTSDAREDRLRRNVRRQSRTWDAALEIDAPADHDDPEDAIPTACVKDDGSDAPYVMITGREIPQPVTDYSPQSWDWIVQRAFAVHEVGHIRYTDMVHWQNLLTSRFSHGSHGVAHSLHNALEDGANEKQITRRWNNYYPILRALRANIFAETTPGIEDPERGGYAFPVVHAIHSACLDLWTREVYALNIGTVDGLLDDDDDELHFATQNDRDLFEQDALPLTEAVVDDVLTTPAPQARNDRIADFIEDVLDLLDDADADGKAQKNGERGQGDDGSGMPDDSRDSEGAGRADADADELGEDGDESGAGGAGDDDDAKDGDESAGGAGDGDDDGDDEQPADGAGDGDDGGDDDGDLDGLGEMDVDADLESRAADESSTDAQQASGTTDAVIEELEEMADSLAQGASAGLESDTVQIPTEPWDVAQERAQRAQEDANSLAHILRQRLQSERRSETRMNQRRGRFTGRGGAAMRASRGRSEVKEQTKEPDEKDYHCLLVLDRSSSMSGSDIEAAELASGMLIEALEEVGVETMLLEMYESTARIAKPFGVSTDSRPHRVYNGQTSGGTPLQEVLEIGKARLDRVGGEKFMIVATDAEIPNPDEYEQTIRGMTFPVIGVNITAADEVTGAGCFDREVVTPADADRLKQALEAELMEVMF